MSAEQPVVTPGVVMQLLIFIVIVPFLPLLISWRWGWWQAWVYGILAVGGFAVSRALAARRHPDLLAERARFGRQPDAAAWDKLLSPLVGLGGGLIPLVAGLDARLGGSPEFGAILNAVALAVTLAGYVLASYALIENRFFSGVVRMQPERGHHVVSSGPYAWMRHPGYAGALLTYWATPLFLDSRWAFVPVAFISIVLVIRTALEDRTLRGHLEGYAEYVETVRYRLVPGVW